MIAGLINVIIWGAIIIVIVWLAIRRYRISKEEDFEKRDN